MPTDIHTDQSIDNAIGTAMNSFRIDDVLFAQAYDATPPALRALLKTAIAFQCHLYEEAPASETRTVHRPTAGFCHTVHEKPAAWTVAVIEPDFDSPARLLAALMPAMMAGVDRFFIVSFGAPLAPSLLVALELAGLEDVFVLPPYATRQQSGIDPLRLLTTLFDENPDGRLLLFPAPHARLSLMLADLARVACHLRLPVWQDAPPRLLALNAPPAPDNGMTLESLLHWAHGNIFVTVEGSINPKNAFPPNACCALADPKDSEEHAEKNDSPMESPLEGIALDEISLYDACYTGHTAISIAPPSCWLALGAGMEACWDSLSRDFFRTRALSACLAIPPERD